MVNTPAVANLIRQGKLEQLETAMQSGGANGMQTMDTALMDLVRKNRIGALEAYQQSNNKQVFKRLVEEEEELAQSESA
jgi:twitching motility protein PilT